jgi:uncharacterized repeat protein (TIGR04076 family)
LKRRKFINTTLAASAAAMIKPGAVLDSKPQESEKKKVVKITVLKKTFNKDFADEFRDGKGSICSVFEEGQEFIVNSVWSKPEGFCDWAWGDIRTLILAVDGGKVNPFVTCCTDGFRPVFFKLELIQV